ncbi:hypothetical protein DV738_g3537, partial [Chaetothyriales sp. CBS 135597]
MPPLPGEDRLVTVFADIHYYFGTPTVHPLLHRFDKASYFYIYYNSTRQTSRIEVANHPGTPDQDAFNGYLDSCRIINSHRFPTLMTLIVDGATPGTSPHSAKPPRDPDEWRLPSGDPRDPGKQSYRIHTMDVYFWAEEDARSVIQALQQLLDPSQLDVAELQPEAHSDPQTEQEPVRHEQDTVHPVVQNLENVAITDPAYQSGQARDGHGDSPHLQQHQQQLQQTQKATNSIPPPPPPPSQFPDASVSPPPVISSTASQPQQPEAAQSFAPMVYNPAAPAAPEPISHREDTPPPADDGHGTGLTAAATHDRVYVPHGSQAWTGVPQTAQYSQYSSPPAQSFSSLPPPPPTAPSFAGPPSAGSSTHPSSISAQPYVPSQTSPSSHHSADPVETPGTQFYNSLGGGHHKPLSHIQPQYPDYLAAKSHSNAPPPGGYSQYSYSQSSHGRDVPASEFDVHSQVYRPTEAEARVHGHHHRQPSRTDPAPGRKESRADRVEKGVGKLFKKMDKKFGIT